MSPTPLPRRSHRVQSSINFALENFFFVTQHTTRPILTLSVAVDKMKRGVKKKGFCKLLSLTNSISVCCGPKASTFVVCLFVYLFK